jgi:hypothetical protein
MTARIEAGWRRPVPRAPWRRCPAPAGVRRRPAHSAARTSWPRGAVVLAEARLRVYEFTRWRSRAGSRRRARASSTRRRAARPSPAIRASAVSRAGCARRDTGRRLRLSRRPSRRPRRRDVALTTDTDVLARREAAVLPLLWIPSRRRTAAADGPGLRDLGLAPSRPALHGLRRRAHGAVSKSRRRGAHPSAHGGLEGRVPVCAGCGRLFWEGTHWSASPRASRQSAPHPRTRGVPERGGTRPAGDMTRASIPPDARSHHLLYHSAPMTSTHAASPRQRLASETCHARSRWSGVLALRRAGQGLCRRPRRRRRGLQVGRTTSGTRQAHGGGRRASTTMRTGRERLRGAGLREERSSTPPACATGNAPRGRSGGGTRGVVTSWGTGVTLGDADRAAQAYPRGPAGRTSQTAVAGRGRRVLHVALVGLVRRGRGAARRTRRIAACRPRPTSGIVAGSADTQPRSCRTTSRGACRGRLPAGKRRAPTALGRLVRRVVNAPGGGRDRQRRGAVRLASSRRRCARRSSAVFAGVCARCGPTIGRQDGGASFSRSSCSRSASIRGGSSRAVRRAAQEAESPAFCVGGGDLGATTCADARGRRVERAFVDYDHPGVRRRGARLGRAGRVCAQRSGLDFASRLPGAPERWLCAALRGRVRARSRAGRRRRSRGARPDRSSSRLLERARPEIADAAPPGPSRRTPGRRQRGRGPTALWSGARCGTGRRVVRAAAAAALARPSTAVGLRPPALFSPRRSADPRPGLCVGRRRRACRARRSTPARVAGPRSTAALRGGDDPYP